MKPRALSAFFVHHVDGQIWMPIGADRYWLDTSAPMYGSAVYGASAGEAVLTRNDVAGPTDTMTTGGRIELNPGVSLHNDFDLRVHYSNVVQGDPGTNNATRIVLRVYDPGNLPHSDARVGLYRSSVRFAQGYRDSWQNFAMPVDAQTSGRFRITKKGVHILGIYIWTAGAWSLIQSVPNVADTSWRVQLYVESQMASWPATPPPAISVAFHTFGVY